MDLRAKPQHYLQAIGSSHHVLRLDSVGRAVKDAKQAGALSLAPCLFANQWGIYVIQKSHRLPLLPSRDDVYEDSEVMWQEFSRAKEQIMKETARTVRRGLSFPG